MVTIDIRAVGKTLFLPESLAECDGEQFLGVSRLIYFFHSGKINYFDFRILAVYVLLGLKNSGKESEAKDENIFRLSERVDSFFHHKKEDGGEYRLELKLDFIHNPLPSCRIFFRRFLGVRDGFENVSFGQYVDGLEEYIHFSKTGDLEALRNLFFIFYLPMGERYERERSRKRARKYERYVDMGYLYGFYIYFTAMQEYILSGQVLVLGSEIDLSIIYQELVEDKKEKSSLPGLGLYSVMHDLAESGVFGNYEGVRGTNMWLVLLRLYELKKRRIDEIAEEKRQKK